MPLCHFRLSAVGLLCVATRFHIIYLLCICVNPLRVLAFPPLVAQFYFHLGIYSLSKHSFLLRFEHFVPSAIILLLSPFCCLLHFLAPTRQFSSITCLCGPILGPLFILFILGRVARFGSYSLTKVCFSPEVYFIVQHLP